jgi:hypothetical protein
MTDIEVDIRPIAELLRTLRCEGVRADNRDRLRRTVANLRGTAKQLRDSYDFSNLVDIEQLEKIPAEVRFESEAVQEVWEQFCLASRDTQFGTVTGEAEDLLEQSVVSTRTILAFQISLEPALHSQAAPQTETALPILRARPVKGKIDHEALTREIIARYPKILAALAK